MCIYGMTFVPSECNDDAMTFVPSLENDTALGSRIPPLAVLLQVNDNTPVK